MTSLDIKVIEKILSSKEAMEIARDFIQRHQEPLQALSADLQAFQEKP